MLIELNQDQIDEILSCMDFSISEGMAGDNAILIARYFRDNYNQNLDSFIWLKGQLRSEEIREEKEKEVWEPTRDKDGYIIAYKKV